MTATLNRLARRLPVSALYIIGALPPFILLYMGATGGLGVEPIEALEHELGGLGLKALIVTLAITPLRRFVGLNMIRFRRAFGLLTFYYICCHLLVWLFLDVQIAGQIWADILKRPYITIGMAAWALMVPLAVTSNNHSIRFLGPRWRQLHRLTYGVAILGAIHFVMLRKGFQLEPLIYLTVILALVALRMVPKRKPLAV
ncbi:protein-methionine-sulfoxide reductase heme-binding subunit MsrQ [Pontibaca salina]|uniref:Protein-methionine-sulfoxide reductase heme-binding subunit MsrQ n=1 Tax=Pontibaca salina TaxID=2795731 RepID=A0A934HUV5_9RHOB|nr:protein-methionine-sulfoxide reductase heme-binding subunit MsrQ [Pontibaca salina]MBI6630945.1 protein-methionine-sulfoxide reductase heme-binding subunit MsrQ [Pontibaca salina]